MIFKDLVARKDAGTAVEDKFRIEGPPTGYEII